MLSCKIVTEVDYACRFYYIYLMKESFNTIRLEYLETNKTSVFVKLVSVFLMVIFMFIPISEFITQFKPVVAVCTYGIAGTCGCIPM